MKRYLPVLLGIAAIALTAAALFPSIFNNFVDWDDYHYVVNNEMIRGLGVRNLVTMFTSGTGGVYCPLVMAAHAIEYRLAGLDPLMYHLTNYLLHLAITAMVYYFIYLLSKNWKVAFFVAAIFGVHPMHVESVAWIAERKDLMCALFYIPALISYALYRKRGKGAYFGACMVFTALSLLSKPMAVTLPIVFFLLDYFFGGRIDLKKFLEKIPFFVMAGLIGLINLQFQVQIGATRRPVDFGNRVYYITKAFLLYISKLILPVRLSAVYPYPLSLKPRSPEEVGYYIAILIVLFSLPILLRNRSRKAVFGYAFFLVTTLPVVQLIPAGHMFAADRYAYLPSIGFFFCIATGLEYLLSRGAGKRQVARAAVAVFVCVWILLLSAASWGRCAIWKNTKTLFTDVIKKHPEFPLSYKKLGVYYKNAGRHDLAMSYYKMALAIHPAFGSVKLRYAEAYLEKMNPAWGAIYENSEGPGRDDMNMMIAMLERLGKEKGSYGDIDYAITLFREIMKYLPDRAETYNDIGFMYFKKGDLALAERYFTRALDIDSGSEKAQTNIGFIEAEKVRLAQRQEEWPEPRSTDETAEAIFLNSIAIECAIAGDFDSAEVLFTEAVRLDPGYAETYNNFGFFWFQKGERTQAEEYFRKALEIDPNHERARSNLDFITNPMMREKERSDKAASLIRQGVAQGSSGNLDGAIDAFLEALAIDPDNAETYNNLGFAYFRKDDREKAEEYFAKALELDPNHERAKSNLEYIRSLESDDQVEKDEPR
ncbi:MAG: tetratricopeptide repeat protein [Candidatus Omnitrophota bacterium]